MENAAEKNFENFPEVDPHGLCPNYIKGDFALPEEVDTCDLCRFFLEDGNRCSNPYKK